MIAWLTGRLRRKAADSVIIDVGGVGYLVAIPLSTFHALPEPGSEVSLPVHTHLREDALSLFGFSTEAEREIFLLLLGVSGIGPKLALSVLSSISAGDLVAAIRDGNDAKLCGIPGIGKKTAARMCLELKDKIREFAPAARTQYPEGVPASSGTRDDAVSALVNLGYKRPLAEDVVLKVHRQNPDLGVADLIREALGVLVQR